MTKWLTGVSPFDRAVYVAARSLETRFDAVHRYLRRAVKKPSDPENVHQLRVWSRRADSALTLYADLIPSKQRERILRTLRRLRRAAGRVRDCDVFAARINGAWSAHLSSERIKAQRKLVAIFERLDCGRQLKRRARALLHRLREHDADSSKTFLQRARETIRPLLAQFFAASPTSTGDEKSLHHFRIAGKNLRYALELLAGAFSSEVRAELYPILSALQDKLGTVNDLAEARDRVTDQIESIKKPARLSELRGQLAETSDELIWAKADFERWWTPELANSLQSRFENLIRTRAIIR